MRQRIVAGTERYWRPVYHLWLVLERWARQHTLPGFRRQSVYQVLRIWVRDVVEIDFTMRASAMAYDFFFALFPTLIFLFSLLPYIPVDNLAAVVQDRLRAILPSDTFQLVQPTVEQTFARSSPGVLVLSVALLLFSATRGVRTMLSAFYLSAPEQFRRRNLLESFALSLLIFFAIGLLFLLGVTLLIGGELVLSYLTERLHVLEAWSYVLLSLLTFAVNLLLLFSMVAFLYYVAPAHARRWHIFSPGSILGGLLLFAAQLLLRWYFLNFANYNKIYGTLATVMVLMVWIYYNSIVLLLGFELNTAIDHAEADSQADTERDHAQRRTDQQSDPAGQVSEAGTAE